MRQALKRGVLALCLAIGSVAVIIVLQILAAQAKPSDADERCRALTRVDWAGAEITSAKLVAPAPAGTVPFNRFTPARIPVALPEHCRVEGVINRRKGADGVEYGIGFALVFPSNWNGRLLYQGGGAFNGSIAEPLGLNASGSEPALARGFAIVSTDAGHKGESFDTTFLKDQQAALDFAFNAVPTVTTLAKDLTAKYFGRGPHHIYADGCSTGGREGMSAAERYPALFDGIISGDPAMRSWHTRIAGWNAVVAFNRIAPKNADGTPNRLAGFPAADQKLLSAAVADKCDARDGLKDGLILNLAACKFDPAVLQCKSGKSASCLSAKQVTALHQAFGVVQDGLGNPIYPGFPYDLGLLGANPTSLVPSPGINPYDTPPSPYAIDINAALNEARAAAYETLTDTADWTDLGSYYRRGGKIIFYHGASDPWYSFYDTLNYFERNKQTNPEFDSSRFYSVPGMAHCGDGGLEGFDMLTSIVDWVENGKAPIGVIASDRMRQMSRPLCPWPQYAHYSGSGDTKDMTNFECRSD